MRARCVLVLLVILALSTALMTAPAGSATQAQAETPGEQTGGPLLKDGGGGTPPGGNTGDDDRWGNARPAITGAPDGSTAPSGEAPVVTTPTFTLRLEVRVVLGFVIVVVTLR